MRIAVYVCLCSVHTELLKGIASFCCKGDNDQCAVWGLILFTCLKLCAIFPMHHDIPLYRSGELDLPVFNLREHRLYLCVLVEHDLRIAIIDRARLVGIVYLEF